jgi:hypothetical protein
MATLTKPTIHLNGTSKDELLEQWSLAYSALYEARTRLAACLPNGRDYYTQGPNVVYSALKEHQARLEKITSVMRDVDELREWAVNGE